MPRFTKGITGGYTLNSNDVFIIVLCAVYTVYGIDYPNQKWTCVEKKMEQFGATSKISRIDGKFLKKAYQYRNHNLIQRETCVLKLLQQFSWAPRLLSFSNTSITTTDVGSPITPINIPADYAIQVDKIIKDMQSVGIKHNDITYPCKKNQPLYTCQPNASVNTTIITFRGSKLPKIEFMVLEGRLSLIDFNWATINDTAPCGEFGSSKTLFHPGWKPCNDAFVLNKLKVYHDIRTNPMNYFVNITQKNAVFTTPVLSVIFKSPQRFWEAHLIIIWETSEKRRRDLQARLPRTLRINEILNRNPITDEKVRFKTLMSFYGVPVRDQRFAMPYTIYLVNDTAPVYELRQTTKGKRLVNINLFDLKKKTRASGSFTHATDNTQETRDNMRVLGLPYPAKPAFSSLKETFEVLNNVPSFSYVVLRNFEGLPNSVTVDEHFDLDILVSDYYTAKRILDAESKTNNRYEDGHGRIQNKFRVGDSWVQVDIRFIGDNYFDKQWQVNLLRSRELLRGFYIPNAENYRYSLLYHAVVQKPHISPTYIKTLRGVFGSMTSHEFFIKLREWMSKKKYGCVKTMDTSVPHLCHRFTKK